MRILEDSTYTLSVGNICEVNAASEMYGESLGTFKLTYYCACEICCDVETGITATGTPVVEGRTIDGNHIDIYVNDHQTALELGTGQSPAL